LAGDSKKILRGSEFACLPRAGVFAPGECPSNVIRFSAKNMIPS